MHEKLGGRITGSPFAQQNINSMPPRIEIRSCTACGERDQDVVCIPMVLHALEQTKEAPALNCIRTIRSLNSDRVKYDPTSLS